MLAANSLARWRFSNTTLCVADTSLKVFAVSSSSRRLTPCRSSCIFLNFCSASCFVLMSVMRFFVVVTIRCSEL